MQPTRVTTPHQYAANPFAVPTGSKLLSPAKAKPLFAKPATKAYSGNQPSETPRFLGYWNQQVLMGASRLNIEA